MSANCAQFSEELVESYSLGRLAGEECARFEEHLLVCPVCQGRLSESDAYVSAAKAAAVSYARKPSARAAASGRTGFFRPPPNC